MRSRPETTRIHRSTSLHARSNHFWTPHASVAMPATAVNEIQATCSHEAFGGTLSSSAMPAGSSTNTNGTTNAGSVYFHDSSVVRYGLPPVMAAAANGDSAVGGDTSESTA